MENNTEIYRGAAIMPKNPQATILSLICVAAFCAAVFIAARFLPMAWLFEIAAILIAAIHINKILKQGAFAQTYVLYGDKLTVITRYGLIEMVTAEYELSKAAFNESFVTYEGKNHPFYPDEALKTLLKIENHS